MNLLKPLLFVILFSAIAFATSVGGVLKKNMVWDLKMNPIVITSDVIVPESLTLDIKAGCDIRFDGYFMVMIKGRLLANGTKEQPIIFTSNSSEPAQSDWNGIIFSGTKSGGALNFCKIRYSFKNLVWKTDITISNCIFADNNYALYYSFSKSSKVLTSKFFKNNYAIYCDFSSPEIRQNRIVENQYGVYCILSSSPIIGQNDITANIEKDIHLDEAMGKNDKENINNHVWDLMKGLF